MTTAASSAGAPRGGEPGTHAPSTPRSGGKWARYGGASVPLTGQKRQICPQSHDLDPYPYLSRHRPKKIDSDPHAVPLAAFTGIRNDPYSPSDPPASFRARSSARKCVYLPSIRRSLWPVIAATSTALRPASKSLSPESSNGHTSGTETAFSPKHKKATPLGVA